MKDLRRIAWAFKDNDVMGIKTYGSMLFSFVNQVLHYVYHTYIYMMTAFCERVCHASIGFIHEIVNDYQPLFSHVKSIFRCKTLNVLNISDLLKAFLPLSVTPYYFLGYRNHHFRYIFN